MQSARLAHESCIIQGFKEEGEAMRHLYKVLYIGVLGMLAGCASVVAQPPIEPGQSVQLQPGEGIAALLMDTLDPLTQIRLESTDGKSPALGLPSMPAGKTLVLFATPAGVYCLTQFNFGRYQFHSAKLELGCFQVTAGHISYSGNLQPQGSSDPSKAGQASYVYQDYRPNDFLVLLKQRYPQMTAAYPTAGPSPTSESGEQNDITQSLATWIVEAADHHSYTVFFRNNTNWDLVLTQFTITTCENLKQACGQQTERMEIAPNTTLKFTTLEQADARQPYQFRYEYNYDEVNMGNKR